VARTRRAIAATALAALWTAGVSAAPATSFSGQATLVNASVPLLGKIVVGDTGPLPASGGNLSSSVAAVNLPGLLTAGVGQSSTSAQGNHSRSSASLADISLTPLGIPVTVDAVQSQAEARCQAGEPQVSAGSQLAGLTINGTPFIVAAPNITLPLAVANVVVNEQKTSTNGATGESTANALHATVLGVDLVVASSHADITCDQGKPGP
jgi:hypothetical protein